MSVAAFPALPIRLTRSEAIAYLSTCPQVLSGRGVDVMLDASQLQHFDSAALAVLMELVRRADRAGVGLRVQGLPERLERLAALYGVGVFLQA